MPIIAIDPTPRRPDSEAAKDVICELIAASKGVLHGKVRLNKAFYFAHLYYWQDADGVLTEYPIVRLPKGPCIDDLNDLLRELVEQGRLIVSTEPVGPYQQQVYRVPNAAAPDPLSPRGRAITQAVDFVNRLSAAELSELTHEFSRSWQSTKDGREMDIYSDLLTDEEIARIQNDIDAVRPAAGAGE